MEYNFADIRDNKQRTEVIQEFIRLIRLGDHSPVEAVELRENLVKKALATSC
jgi:hypothetical protein